jgi:hypothetical protein
MKTVSSVCQWKRRSRRRPRKAIERKAENVTETVYGERAQESAHHYGFSLPIALSLPTTVILTIAFWRLQTRTLENYQVKFSNFRTAAYHLIWAGTSPRDGPSWRSSRSSSRRRSPEKRCHGCQDHLSNSGGAAHPVVQLHFPY